MPNLWSLLLPEARRLCYLRIWTNAQLIELFENDICNEDCASNGKKRKKGTKTKEHDHTKETDACLGLDESKRRITALVMWYLNPIDRLRRMFANPVLSRLMVWWFFEWTRDEEKLDHPADGSQWKHFDDMYPEFTKDPRNVRFALSTDGMN